MKWELKKIRPTSPGRRGMTGFDFSEITKFKPEKSLTKEIRKTGARNNHGQITMRYHGGGHKRKYRIVDFHRSKLEVSARVAAIEYDPNRTCRIALLHYIDGAKSYILAPVGLEVGNHVVSSAKADIKPGNSLRLSEMPVGTIIHNIELRPGKGGQLCRSAGGQATLVGRVGHKAQIKLPSGEVREGSCQLSGQCGAGG